MLDSYQDLLSIEKLLESVDPISTWNIRETTRLTGRKQFENEYEARDLLCEKKEELLNKPITLGDLISILESVKIKL